MRFIPALLLVVTFLFTQPTPATAFPSDGHFGADFVGAKSADISELAASPRAFAGKRVRVRGFVTDVCKNSGCWLVVSDGERQMKVTIKNHAFSVPADIQGERVVVEGFVTATRGRRPVVSMVASGVQIR
jgi:hypothetical protein